MYLYLIFHVFIRGFAELSTLIHYSTVSAKANALFSAQE
jgi:hypothetical protein